MVPDLGQGQCRTIPYFWVSSRKARRDGCNSIRRLAELLAEYLVGLIVAGYGLANGLIGREVCSASVIMVLVTTMVTPPLCGSRSRRPRAAADATVEETIAGPPEEAEDAP